MTKRVQARHLLAVLAAAGAACTADPVPAGDITGKVTVQDGTLEGVFVSIPGAATLPAADGTFAFRGLALGAYEVTATKDGYEPLRKSVAVEANKAAVVDFALVPRPRENRPPLLSSLTVSPAVIARGGTGTASALATDPDGDALTFTWSAGDGWTVTAGEGGTATITAPATGSATTDLRVTVSDGTASVEGTVRLGTEANRAPVVASVVAVPPVVAPGAKAVLVVSASDADGDDLSYTWTAPEGWSVEGAGAQVEVVAPNAWGANGIVRVTVADDAGAQLEAAVGVSTPANQAPVFSSLVASPFVVAPGGEARLLANAADPDGGAVTFTWAASEGWTLVADGASATLTAPATHGAEATVTVTATDAAGAATSATLLVRTSANAAPVLASLVATPPQLRPGAAATVTASAVDPEGATLTYTWTVPEGWTLEGEGAEVSVTAPATYGAVARLGLRVTDAAGASTAGELALSTVSDGGPLVQGITATPPALRPGASAQVSVAATDPDGDALTYAWTAPEGWVVAGEGAQVTVTAPATYGAVGTLRVTVTSNGASAETSIVLSTRTDTAPAIASLVAQPTPVVHGGTVTLTADAADADGDALTYAWTAPEGWTLAGTGASVTLAAPSERSVSGVARLVVTSGSGLAATAQVLVATADNRAPEITSATVDKAFLDPEATATLAVAALDRDGDELTYDWAAPAGWTITGTGASVTIRAPRAADASGTVVVSVTDPLGASAVARIPVKTFANRAPVLAALVLSATEVRAGTTLTATATATDADLQELTYEWTVPAGWTVTGTGASVTLTATSTRGTTGTVSVTVDDGFGGTDGKAATVATRANAVPTLTLALASSTPLALVPATGVALTATVVDADEDAPVFTWTPSAGWTVDGSGATVTLVPPATFGETGSVELSVADGFGGTATASVEVATRANAAPVVASLTASRNPQFAGEEVVVTAVVTDADGHTPTYTWTAPAGWTVVEDAGATLTLRSPTTRGATGELSLTVADGVGGTATRALALSTLANRVPTAFFSAAGPLSFDPGETQELTLATDDEDLDTLTIDLEQAAGWTVVREGDAVRITAPEQYGQTGFVRAVVSDGFDGGLVTASLVVATPENGAPVIAALAATPVPVQAGQRVTLSATTGDPERHELTYAWTLPDGWTALGNTTDATLVLTAPAERGATATVTLHVSDGFGGEDEETVEVGTFENRDPTATLAGTTTELDRGATAVVTATVEDEDGDAPELAWSIAGAGWSVTGSGTSVTVQAPDAFDSTATLTVSLDDGFGGTATVTQELSTRTASAPVIASLTATPTIVTSGGTVVVTAEATDDGGGAPTYAWTVPSGWTAVGPTDGATLTLTAPAARGLEASISLTVTGASGLTATDAVTAETQENRRPEVAFVFEGENLEPGDLVEGEAVVTDLDGDEPTFTWTVSGPFAIDFEGGVVLVEAPDTYGATGTLTLFVDDGFEGTETIEVPLSTRSNVAPTIATLTADPALVQAGETVTVTAVASDDDGHDLTYAWTVPEGWTVEGAATGASLVLRAPATRGAEGTVGLRVADGFGGSDESSVVVETVPNNVPTVTIAGMAEPLAPGASVELTAVASDDDASDTLAYEWTAPAGWTVTGEGDTVTVQAPDEYAAAGTVQVTVTDGQGGSVSATQDLSTRENADPVVASVTATPALVQAGDTVEATVTATDDETTFTYTWAAPEGWTVTGDGATVTITTGSARGVTKTVSVTVSDGRGGSATGTVDVSTEENDTPEADEIVAAKTELAPGEELALSVTATDGDGDTLAYAWTALTAGWTVSGTTDEATVTAPEAFSASGTLQVEVTDGFGGTVTRTIALTTKANTSPVLTTTAPGTPLRAGRSLFTYAPGATDADGTSLVFAVEGAPAGLTFSAETGLVRWAPTRTQAGTFSFDLAASDGELSAAQAIALTVEPFALVDGGTHAITDGEALATGDVDADGRADLFVGSTAAPSIALLPGTETGTFGTATTLTLPSGCVAALTLGDLTGDTHLDLVAADGCGGNLWLLAGDGAGAFAAPVSVASGFTAVVDVVLADVDADGDLDLLASGTGSDAATTGVRPFTNEGTGALTAAGGITAVDCPGRLAAGQLSGAAGAELVVARTCSSTVDVLGLSETGLSVLSTLAPAVATTGACTVVPTLGDVDGDLDLDLVAALGCDGRVVTFVNGTSFTEGGTTTGPTFTGGRGVTLADLDHDGALDLVLANGSTEAAYAIAFGDGLGGFSAPVAGTSTAVSQTRAVVTGDFDDDGLDDVAAIGTGGVASFR